MKSPPRHFLELTQVASVELRRIVDMGASFKRGERPNGSARPLDGRALAMIFEKPSTRTRVSFEIAMKQLGGSVVVLTPNEMQIGRGETIADTARVLSRYVDAIMMRTTENLVSCQRSNLRHRSIRIDIPCREDSYASVSTVVVSEHPVREVLDAELWPSFLRTKGRSSRWTASMSKTHPETRGTSQIPAGSTGNRRLPRFPAFWQ